MKQLLAEKRGSIAITGLGMVSSLGHSVVTACAASRAGIVRTQNLECIQFPSNSKGEVESVIGYQVPFITEGFEGHSRLLRLMQTGLSDLKNYLSDEVYGNMDIKFYLSLPDPYRVYKGKDLILDEQVLQSYEDTANDLQESENKDTDIDVDNLLTQSVSLNGLPGKAFPKFVTQSGHTGVAEALYNAADDLSNGVAEIAIVGGVDSLLDDETMWWLHNTHRLKTPGLPVGLQPGEAAAFLLVERLRSAKKRKADVFAILEDICLGEERATLLSAELSMGQGLFEVIRTIMDSAGLSSNQKVWFVTDHNGEYYRAHEWGNAIVRLVERSQVFSESEVWYPAASLGDTGAASGAVSACMVINAFDRGYAASYISVLISTADGPERSAFILRSPEKTSVN